MVRLFTPYGEYLRNKFGVKVQKLSVNAGFSCPNRDGSIGRGGCIYCDNRSFTPSYCNQSDSVTEQIEKGKLFFGRKYPELKYIAYFQAYTSTYSVSLSRLTELYCEALGVDDVVGLVIGTRPDCFDKRLAELLGEIGCGEKKVLVEFGAESSHDETLLMVNRGHTWQQTADAVWRAHDVGIDVGLHFIMGLPGETHDMMLRTVERAVELPVSSHRRWKNGELNLQLFDVDSYLDLCREICDIVPKSIAIERFTSSAPAELLVAPKWGIKNYEFVNRLLSSC